MSQVDWHLPDPETQPEFYDDVPMKRLIAFLVDTLVIFLITVVIVPFTAFTGLFFFPLLMMVIGFAYRVITLTGSSATLGMRLTAIEFRTAGGERFDLSTAALHTIGLCVSFGLPILQLVSVILMATTEKGQGLTDNVLGTVAVNRSSRR